MQNNRFLTHTDEFPLDSLHLTELVMQFKVMKALGYKSLFDPGFRREMRNVVRKVLYYRIVLAEESMDKRFLRDLIQNLGERLSFFSDPELYRKVQDVEQKEKISDPEEYRKLAVERSKRMEKVEKSRVALTPQETIKVADFLKKS